MTSFIRRIQFRHLQPSGVRCAASWATGCWIASPTDLSKFARAWRRAREGRTGGCPASAQHRHDTFDFLSSAHHAVPAVLLLRDGRRLASDKQPVASPADQKARCLKVRDVVRSTVTGGYYCAIGRVRW